MSSFGASDPSCDMKCLFVTYGPFLEGKYTGCGILKEKISVVCHMW